MSKTSNDYWFPAKTYGYGWGLPTRSEGWIVLITWLAIIIPVSPLLAMYDIRIFIPFILLMSLALIGICYAKGEPPRWRWGRD